MNIDNRKNKAALVDFLSDLDSDGERPTKETEASYITALIQKRDKRLKIGMRAKNTSQNFENLEDLAETVSEIGEVERVKELKGGGNYDIILRIAPNEFGTNLVEVLKQKISQYTELCRKIGEVMGLTEFNHYLGNWKEGSLELRHKVGSDLSKLYPVLKDRLKVSPEDVYADFKSENIPAARAIISLFLRGKYKELSFQAIGNIIKKNHATIMLRIGKFKDLTLTSEDYEDPAQFVDKVIPNYHGRRLKK